MPFLQLLRDEDWLSLTKQMSEGIRSPDGTSESIQQPDSTDQQRLLMLMHAAHLRSVAKRRFGLSADEALQRFMKANSGQFPTNSSQLASFFTPAIDDTVWLRYEVIPREDLPGMNVEGDRLIAEKSPAGSKAYGPNENRLVIGKGGSSFTPHGFGYLGR